MYNRKVQNAILKSLSGHNTIGDKGRLWSADEQVDAEAGNLNTLHTKHVLTPCIEVKRKYPYNKIGGGF